MKFLKWLLIIVVIIIGAALIAAAFLPAHVSISANTLVNKPASHLFHNIATFQDRVLWDPWVSTDSTTMVEINATERYIGSTYEWNGEKVRTGKVRVDSIVYGEYISSGISFGNEEDEATVIWKFEESPEGTIVTWSFESDPAWPGGRLFMAFGKGMLQKSYENGLTNLKSHFEGQETKLSNLSEIMTATKPAMNSIVCEASGTMEELKPLFEKLFTDAYNAISEQGLQINGPAFGYYYNYNEEAGTVSLQCGFPVTEKGKSTDKVIAKYFPEAATIKAIHTGPYEEFESSYTKMMNHVQENEIGVTWEVFEEYLTDMQSEPLSTLWKTAIYFVKE